MSTLFKDKFLTHVNNIITFDTLTNDMILYIVNIQLVLEKERLNNEKIALETIWEVVEYQTTYGFNPLSVARTRKGVIQKETRD